ncbi:DNA-binding protein [Saccharopolyspora elongata]|uniref:DNA-binding protein n=1 Tax=Saccharopolyspora elongata TaxID=2530387 RepID=A0A4V2YJ48_9PSEU|nr:DNA-binding protein [Saccharopolyspora elongata]
MAGRVPPLEIASSGSGGHGHVGGDSLVATATARKTACAWECFAAGEDIVQGVRPEILASWYRCRDQYEVDPALHIAPGAPEGNDHRLDHDVIFTQLGGLGALAGRDVELDGGVVAVTDGTGRILGSWGDPTARKRADLSNLAPWSAWSEQCTGTNGMGTSFELPGPITVTGPEHWCEGFQQWACAGISIRDVVTGSPVASINISRWKAPLSEHVPTWLRNAAASVEEEIHRRAIMEAKSVVAGFEHESAQMSGPLMAVDRGAHVIAANCAAISLLKLADDNPIATGAAEPAKRWKPDIPELPDVVRWAMGRALQRPQWSGYARLSVCPGEDALPVSMRPVVASNNVVGMFCAFGLEEGEPYEKYSDVASASLPPRVIGVRDERLVLLAPSEIRYAQADRNIVWLSTDRGRIQAATRGLDNVEELLAPHGFRRVHRRFLTNLRRVVELERGIKGELVLITDLRCRERVPVSRRHAPEIRRLLGV